MKLLHNCCLTAVFFTSVLMAACAGPEITGKPPAEVEGPGRVDVSVSLLERTPKVRVLLVEGKNSIRI